jgi:cyanophycinase
MPDRNPSAGRLLLIGGNEDPDEDRMEILPHLVRMSGGAGSRILVCSAPSEQQERKVRVYRTIFEKIGVAEVIEAPVSTREEAEDPDLLKNAGRATAVFITGGDQLRLTATIAGTPFWEVVRERMRRGEIVLSGTSAGAAAMSSTMIIGGRDDGTVRRADVDLAPGLNYWTDTVIDTHFNQRGRLHRLLTIFAQNPQTLGVGIDENTALELEPGKRFTVIGEHVVTVFDGRVSHTSAPECSPDQVNALTDATVHVLTAGYRFDLRTRRPVHPDGTVLETVSRA